MVSAILVRALLSALEDSVLEAGRLRATNHINAVVRSHSKPETAAECWLNWLSSRCGVLHGDETKVTYHLGVLAIVQAMGDPDLARDFWQAYPGCWELSASTVARPRSRNRFAAPQMSCITS